MGITKDVFKGPYWLLFLVQFLEKHSFINKELKSPHAEKRLLVLRPFDPHHPAIGLTLVTVKRFVIGRYTLFIV